MKCRYCGHSINVSLHGSWVHEEVDTKGFTWRKCKLSAEEVGYPLPPGFPSDSWAEPHMEEDIIDLVLNKYRDEM